MKPNKKSLNFITLQIFAPVLILAGILGFITPAQMSLTSGATPYNIFHIIFGIIGIILVIIKNEEPIQLFNIGFGLIDIYQAIASFTHIFPENFFRWTRVDDLLHIIIGGGLIFVGFYGRRSR